MKKFRRNILTEDEANALWRSRVEQRQRAQNERMLNQSAYIAGEVAAARDIFLDSPDTPRTQRRNSTPSPMTALALASRFA